MAGRRPDDKTKPVVLFDDDHYVMGPLLTELLSREGYTVTLVTPAGIVGSWSQKTAEQARSHEKEEI